MKIMTLYMYCTYTGSYGMVLAIVDSETVALLLHAIMVYGLKLRKKNKKIHIYIHTNLFEKEVACLQYTMQHISTTSMR